MSIRLLSIESAGTLCSVAVSGFSSEVFLESEPNQKHTEVILGMISGAMKSAQAQFNDLDAISFGCGPGAFTGIRVACAMAQGLGWALDKKLVPVGNLYALSFNWLETLTEGERILAATDARMHECYCAVYRREQGKLTTAVEPCLVKPEELAAVADDNAANFCCGNAFEIYKEEVGALENCKLLSTEPCDARMVSNAAKVLFDLGKAVSPEQAAPVYVRNHVAMTIQERSENKKA